MFEHVTQLLVVWCPDWPVVAASTVVGLPLDTPAAVVAANRVICVNAGARAEGVRRGMRRRESQGRCPDLVVFPDDLDRDAGQFEPVAAAVEELAVGVEVVRPGVVAVPARGPVGYFGSVAAAAERLIDQVAARTGAECQVGVADGLFAATLAAHRGKLVPPGGSPEFLAPLAIGELDGRPELVDLLRRLGIRTLGDFAALSPGDVTSRFGADAGLAHRLARGLEERPPARRRPPVDLSVTHHPDPPIDRVDAAAFVARELAERLHAGLAAHGLACTRLRIHASTANGETHDRGWRCAEPLTPSGIADRVRWQLDGWLRGAGRPSAGVTLLRLDPEELVDGRALQLGLWQGGHDERAERAGRAMVHVQGLLGPDAVLTPILSGGRGPADQVHLVPWGDERAPPAPPDRPWPGRLPAPSPAVVPATPLPVTVVDEAGVEVGVTGRFRLTGAPVSVTFDGRPRVVVGWSGPWAADERWWDPASARRRARLQVLLAEQSEEDSQDALLLVREDKKWSVEGIYR
ncbi:DNA polymerase-like protein PA0670 [Alloactinosynnema sp. L-07]|uniref:DNA polymerase Y family protein n=1 Tax=Alloactinosynnema sp. L-07 TaxID=1653480 RepID=UPI00065F0801|nr:DNA polymerase Y family protein [Alloactinosynnema sp. L-07]CRK59901.1 DNA polymerase-like protein PA0670 [Alloactinosynnema sp. L-07]